MNDKTEEGRQPFRTKHRASSISERKAHLQQLTAATINPVPGRNVHISLDTAIRHRHCDLTNYVLSSVGAKEIELLQCQNAKTQTSICVTMGCDQMPMIGCRTLTLYDQ